jgi:hypothetical protein
LLVFVVQRVQPGRRGAKGACVAPSKTNRRHRACTRWVTLRGGFRMTIRQAGSYSFTFRGRVGGRTLARGSYRLALIPFIASVVERPHFIRFRVK